MKSISATVVCVALVLLGWVHPVSGQNVTTGTITGLVSDQQGGVLPGATVTAVHEPTGTTYEGVTQGDGRFSLLNVRVGGPYQVVVTLGGFRSENVNAVTVTPGRVDGGARHAGATELSPRSSRSPPRSIPLFTASKAGTSDNVATEVLETLPTINRSIQDFARVVAALRAVRVQRRPLRAVGRRPQHPLQQPPDRRRRQQRPVQHRRVGGHAGRLGRDAADQPRRHSGTAARRGAVRRAPGKLLRWWHQRHHPERHQQRSTDRRSTSSAIRVWSATGSTIGRSPPSTTNSSAARSAVPSSGARRSSSATSSGAGRTRRPDIRSSGSSGVAFGRQAEAQRFLDILQRRYSYNPGTLDEFIRDTKNDKVFARADFNLGQQPADRPSQLRRWLQRRRHAEQRHVQVAGQLLPVPQPDQLDGRSAEFELWQRSSTSSA